jgi:carbonic anhydrase/acetyltransferase-like protein (isoleucine patch superfamily)
MAVSPLPASWAGVWEMPLCALDGFSPRLAAESWVAPTAVLIGRVRLHREASVWFGAVLRADDEPIEIGARSNVQDNCVFHVDPGYPLTVDHDCTIGHHAMVHGCTIGSNTLIGMCSTVLNGARIGRNCLIGANALITENKVIPDNSVVMGAPGRVVRETDEAGARALTQAAALYVARWRRYVRGFTVEGAVATDDQPSGRKVQ